MRTNDTREANTTTASEAEFVFRSGWRTLGGVGWTTGLSGVAHLVVLAILMQFDAPVMGESRLLDAVESRFVAVEAITLPPPVELAEIVEPEPEALEPEPEPVEEPELDAVPTEREIEAPTRVAREEPVEAEVDEPVVEEAVATNIIRDAAPVVTSTDEAAPIAVAAAPAVEAAVSRIPEDAVVPDPNVEPLRLDADNADRIARVRARYERQVHTRLSRLGDAPSRLLRSADDEGPFEVELVAVVDERGRILELRLVRSSGLPELDEFAQTSVARLRRLVRVPDELGDDARRVPISLVYEA